MDTALLRPAHPPGIAPGERTLVVGMGRSGTAAASLVLAAGGTPVLVDDAPAQLTKPAVEALVARGAVRAGMEPLTQVSLVVTSPGVPGSHPILADARNKKIPVWSELELAFRYCACPVLAVTGSDGKSTTCALLAHLIASAGRKVVLGGNIGTPLSALVQSITREAFAVVEVSSYQLESSTTFRPWVAALLNVAPDHLERHGSLTAYAQAKARIFACQGPGDSSVVNADRPGLQDLIPATAATRLHFSARGPVDAGACVTDGWLSQVDDSGARRILSADLLPLPGLHNVENALAALAMALPLRLTVDSLAAGLHSFKALPHRIELVATVRGVRYINDSKATNVHSAVTGLVSIRSPVVLLAGGKDKGLSFEPLAEATRKRVKSAIVYGEAAARLESALEPVVPTLRVRDLAAAVEAAAAGAVAGDVVLLSPACSSFDAYGSFEERGEHFRALVLALPGIRPDSADQEMPKKSSR